MAEQSEGRQGYPVLGKEEKLHCAVKLTGYRNELHVNANEHRVLVTERKYSEIRLYHKEVSSGEQASINNTTLSGTIATVSERASDISLECK